MPSSSIRASAACSAGRLPWMSVMTATVSGSAHDASRARSGRRSRGAGSRGSWRYASVEDVRAHPRVVEAVEDRVRARADLLGGLGRRRTRRRASAAAARGAARARCGRCGSSSRRVAISSRTRASMPSRIARTSSIGLPAGSGMSHASTVVGTYGQASPQPIVIAQSACSCISSVSFFGLRPARSIPTSRIASTTVGHISCAGSVPADSARTSSGP